MSPSTLALILLAALVLAAMVLYNKLARLRNATANALAQIDVQLKRRYDLIPNLVEVARKYMAHERETLEAVITARNQASQARTELQAHPGNPQAASALMGAEGMLQSGLGRLFALAENYPELKADQTLRDLSEEITHTENRVGFARQAYNDSVLDYNNAATQFPGNLVARLFGHAAMPMLESTTSDAERATLRFTL